MSTLYLDTSALVKRYNPEIGSHVNVRLALAGLSGLTFVAADNDLLNAAHTEGLATENPNHHP